MKKYRRKKQINPFQFLYTVFILAFLASMMHFGIETSFYISIFASIIYAILCLIIPMIQKQRKKREYLSSSLYVIDKMNPYEFESLVGTHFETKGYKVTQTPKSGDYGADLLLERADERICVQVKRYSEKVGVRALQETIAGMRFYKCEKGMVVTNSFFTNQAKKMAEECDIILIDRNDLKNDFKIKEK